MLDSDVDMTNDDFEKILRAFRSMNANAGRNYNEGNTRNVIGIIAVCVTIILSALGIAAQFSSFEGEMREWKRATESRMDNRDARIEHDEQLLFERLKGPP